jgi:hypothetical protein
VGTSENQCSHRRARSLGTNASINGTKSVIAEQSAGLAPARFTPQADMCSALTDVRQVPIADIESK